MTIDKLPPWPELTVGTTRPAEQHPSLWKELKKQVQIIHVGRYYGEAELLRLQLQNAVMAAEVGLGATRAFASFIQVNVGVLTVSPIVRAMI